MWATSQFRIPLAASAARRLRWTSTAASPSPSSDVSDAIHSRIEEMEAVAASPRELSSIEDYREDIPPFAKNLFLGKFDAKVLTFPQVLLTDRYMALEKRCSDVHSAIEKRLDLVNAINSEGKISKDILLQMKSQGIYGLQIDRKYGGQGLCVTESMRLLEELSVNMSLSEAVTVPSTLVVQALQQKGTDQQKEKYLPRMATGEILGAVALADERAGVDYTATATKADYDQDIKKYYISGKKTWVTNGASADFFIVTANLPMKNEAGVFVPKLSAFIVDRSAPGVSIGKPEKKVGLKGLETCSVMFENTVVSEESVLGVLGQGGEVFSAMALSQRCLTSARIAVTLKDVLNEVIKHSRSRTAFGKRLCEFESVQQKIAKMAFKLFALESMVYMTAGLADVQKNVDVDVEASMCKLYALKTYRDFMRSAINIFGAGQTYLEDSPLHMLSNDLLAYELWEGTEDMLRMMISVCGMVHAAKELHENVSKWRNPLWYPVEFFRKVYRVQRYRAGNPKLVMGLHDHVHPSLVLAAQNIEYCTIMLGHSVEAVFVHYGINSQLKGAELERLSDIATDILACGSALARANRSYCHGHANGAFEVNMAHLLTHNAKMKTKHLTDLISTGFYSNGDKTICEVTDYIMDRGNYCAVHPITKNFF